MNRIIGKTPYKAKKAGTAHKNGNNVDITVTVMVKRKYFICYIFEN